MLLLLALLPVPVPELVLADAACDAAMLAEVYDDDDVAWQRAALIVAADDAVHTRAAQFAHPAAVLLSV